MKKTIALVLTVIIAFSFSTVAFSADKATIPSTVETLQYDVNYYNTKNETKWYSVKAVNKFLMLVAVGASGEGIELSLYDTEGNPVILDSEGGSGEALWSWGKCYAVTSGNTYYVKADFNGAHFFVTNCWVNFSEYNSYDSVTLADFKLVKSGVTKAFNNGAEKSWDVYEVSDDYEWTEHNLPQNGGCYWLPVKLVSDSPVHFENNNHADAEGFETVYKGLYTERGYIGDELRRDEYSFFAVSYDVVNYNGVIRGQTTRASILIYVEAGSTLSEKDGVVRVDGPTVIGITPFFRSLIVDLAVYFHGFIFLIEDFFDTILGAITGIFA